MKKDIPNEVPNPCRKCGKMTIRQFGYCKKCASKLLKTKQSTKKNTVTSDDLLLDAAKYKLAKETMYELIWQEIMVIKNRLNAIESRFKRARKVFNVKA